jgi:hypothetical protein
MAKSFHAASGRQKEGAEKTTPMPLVPPPVLCTTRSSRNLSHTESAELTESGLSHSQV